MVTGLGQQQQCWDSPAAPLPRAAAPESCQHSQWSQRSRYDGKGAGIPRYCVITSRCGVAMLSIHVSSARGIQTTLGTCCVLHPVLQGPARTEPTNVVLGCHFCCSFSAWRPQGGPRGASLLNLGVLCWAWWIAVLVEVGYTCGLLAARTQPFWEADMPLLH